MRKTTKSPGEKIVKDIKRATRKQYSSEEKIRIVLDGLRGGSIPTPKQIRADALGRDYHGYRAEEIGAASKKREPQQLEALRAIRLEVMALLGRDLSRYRQLAHELRQHWRDSPLDWERLVCLNIHTNLCLKFAHIYNDFRT